MNSYSKVKWKLNNKGKVAKQKKRWREKNKNNPIEKIKEKSRRLANSHISIKGKKCQRCGEKAEERHHKDYSKPFEVEFYCHKCHFLIDYKGVKKNGNVDK